MAVLGQPLAARADDRARAPRRERDAAVRGPQGARRRQLHDPSGPARGADRPERRRQVEHGQLLHGPLPRHAGDRRDRRQRRHRACAPHKVARLGVSRTFQNLALFKGMTVLENLMVGRYLHGKTGIFRGMFYLPGSVREEEAQRERVEEIIDLLHLARHRNAVRARPALRDPEAGRARAGARPGPAARLPRRADDGHVGRGEGGHVAVRPRRARDVRDHDAADRARHGRRDEHRASRSSCSTSAASSPTAPPPRCSRTTR